MRRVVSLYLPDWPTDRLRRKMGAPPPDAPMVTAGLVGRRRGVVAADRAARAQGIHGGLALTEAQARVPGLIIADADPAADEAALVDLALWALRRYSPIVAPDLPDGLLLDVTGVAHLFGGEQALLADMLGRLDKARVSASVALAGTVGAAHGLARFGRATMAIVRPGEDAAAVGPLPPAALRLAPAIVDRLSRLGFDSIADLEASPRAPLALRFGPEPVRRLDQMFGRLAEPLIPICPPALIQARRAFAEPIGAPETLAKYTGQLADSLCATLETKGLGARRLDLLFQRVDGTVKAIRAGTAKPVRDAARLTRLLTDRLETVDPGFGVETMTLSAPLVEPLAYRQAGALGRDAAADISGLIDTLSNRLGAERLYRLAPVESDLPERSIRRIAPLAPPANASWPEGWPRPARLLPRPEPVEILALLPDQPPARFTWRGVPRRVARADGPERVFGEWWRREAETHAVRDYFLVEDEGGERFWLFRAGDGEDAATGDLSWYMHGLFA